MEGENIELNAPVNHLENNLRRLKNIHVTPELSDQIINGIKSKNL